ncbi:WD40 repeat-like protein [Cucurbitaria berberidis CBS 394.84]|uniref:WD40 repeat-like protein n=1 Tax=Cucurbitaria berberidis CBS 394.84 TaxID=1168544 RepID=A0A9P4L5V8_9PLEO|nr:WD40 repeat-like protein [Cucurbitaria berberidis CBS 394.84]KAF1843110.1 WD40 repeat-like protein [Cucurbitaria berberidis CBS 394.84]
MHRRPSILSYRPKTSSALDDDNTAVHTPFDHTMKRTASQTFNTHYHDVRDTGITLDAVNEAYPGPVGAAEQHAHSSLSRAFGAVTGSFTRQKARRRMSSFSSATSAPRRRGSIQSFIESLPSSSTSRKTSTEQQRLPLQHQDSGIPSFQMQPQSAPLGAKSFSFKRLSSMRRRPTASSSSSGELLRNAICNPPIPYPSQTVPGAAARQAAAAANQDRQNQLRREQEHTHRFLNGLITTSMRDDDIKDNESGVDMTCASPIVRADSVTEKKMIDPFQRLPAELATTVLSNLDAASLVRAERVSRSWNEHAASPHVWRSVFLRQYEPEVHVSPTPIQMGGLGVGKMAGSNPAPAQNWKKMFEARSIINKRWKAGTPAAIYLNGHTDSVYCCQFDENKAITGSRDRTIRVWDLKTYKCLKVYGGPNHRPTANTPPTMEERPERVISYNSLNGTRAGNDIYHVPSDYHDASILCLQFDDEIMVTGSSDYTCIVWDITGDEFVPMYRLRGHEAGVLDVCLDDKYIISCSKDAMIKVWDRKTGICVRTLKGHRGPVNAVQLRGNFLVSASGDGVAKLWNLETGLSIKDFPSEDRGLAAVEFSDDAKYVLAGGNDHVVYKFDASTGELVHSRVKHDGLVRSLFLDAFNGRIVSGSYDQSIQVSDYETGRTYAVYKNWTTSWILSAKSDYRRVVATSQDGRTLILDFGHNVPFGELLVGSK